MKAVRVPPMVGALGKFLHVRQSQQGCVTLSLPCRPLHRCMSDDMAVPLTAVWATQLMYSREQQAALQEFNLHLVGAAQFELAHVSHRLFAGLQDTNRVEAW